MVRLATESANRGGGNVGAYCRMLRDAATRRRAVAACRGAEVDLQTSHVHGLDIIAGLPPADPAESLRDGGAR